jgi:hypothetical protein
MRSRPTPLLCHPRSGPFRDSFTVSERRTRGGGLARPDPGVPVSVARPGARAAPVRDGGGSSDLRSAAPSRPSKKLYLTVVAREDIFVYAVDAVSARQSVEDAIIWVALRGDIPHNRLISGVTVEGRNISGLRTPVRPGCRPPTSCKGSGTIASRAYSFGSPMRLVTL